MQSQPLPSIAQSISDDIDAFEHDHALARLADPKDGGGLSAVTAGLLRARAQVGLERWRAAYDTLQQVRNMRELGTADRLEAQVATARVLRIGWWSLDWALEMALAAAEQATRTGANALAVEAHLEAAILFGRKRTRKLAQAQLDAAAALAAQPERVWATRGDLAITFDERPVARTAFERALEHGEDTQLGARARRLGRLGLSRLCTILGEFDDSEQHLVALGQLRRGDIGARRVAWQLHAARAQWPAVAKVLQEILQISPEGDPARGLMLEAASASYRAGDHDAARAAWTRIAATGGGDHAARTAASVLDHLAAGRTRRTRLQAFPSVTQLRDHCGPASVELCLRYFGTKAEQVTVAREIKHPDGGTPVHRMRQYMIAAGFHTRRIEADLDRTRAILDAGIPLIIEEDYSTTRHVAVAIGYDDARQLLEVQDPMTHEVRETLYGELPKLREFSNHGALVAVPSDRADLVAALDAAGAIECEYISRTDQAWEAHDQGRDEDAERLVAEAIALHEPYELAWVLRFVRTQNRHRQSPSAETEAELQQVLDAIVRLWPDDEWPQQFLGRVRDAQGRSQDALAAFERARDRDPDDANNWCSIGDCKLALGDGKGAREAFEQALRRDPGHVRSNENLADMAIDAGDAGLAAVLSDCALELAPNNAFNWYVRGKIRSRAERLDDAIVAFARALELRPESSGFAIEHARVLARKGQVDEAIAGLQARVEQRPGDGYLLTNFADLAYNHGRWDTCLALCEKLAAVDPNSPTPFAIGGAARCMRGELDAGVTELRTALQRRPTYAWAYRELGRAFAKAERWPEAIQAAAAGLGFANVAEGTFLLGDVLARAGYLHDGVGYLRRAAWTGALDEGQLDRVAAVVSQHDGIGGAHELLGELGKEFPRAKAPARAHARLLLETIWAPGAAVAVLSRLSELAPQDPWVLANEADDLMSASLADEARGEALMQQAIAAAPSLVAPRRFYARQLNTRGRFAEALEVLAPCPASAETMADRVHAWLGLDREGDAIAAIDAWCETLHPDVRAARRRPLEFKIAKANRRWEQALELAIALGADAGELDDDGKLSRWEQARFECLVELGRSEEALRFGVAQCGRASDFGDLAYAALGVDDALAKQLAERCLAIDANDGTGLTVLARVHDNAGDVAQARSLWQRMKQVSSWHIHDENLGRLALADGDLDAAQAAIEAAVARGHTCPVALQLRAELRVLRGDRDGARADAERARACLQLERRSLADDLDGLVAALHDRRADATAAYERWSARTHAASDRAVVAKVREALGV
ncbi:MAG: tetratricopeptide repeat protein [Nannocystaceae bacterium]